MLNRLFPAQIGARSPGQPAALWLLGLFTLLKLAMGTNMILNSRQVAAGADGFPLDAYGPGGAGAVLMLFALLGWSQLVLAGTSLLVLVRYRGMVPLMWLILLVEHLGRRGIVSSHAIERAAGASPAGGWLNWGLLAVLVVGLLLSLWPRRP